MRTSGYRGSRGDAESGTPEVFEVRAKERVSVAIEVRAVGR
jgi:hypothetical protein